MWLDGLPVLPVCLFLQVGLDGIGWDAYEERFWNHPLLRFEYSYVGLPALDGAVYVSSENLLGVALASLMRLPAEDRARIKAEGLDRIARSRENEAKRYLLAECFDNYLQLGECEQSEFEQLRKERFHEGRTMAIGWLEQGRAKGIRQMFRTLLEKKFGPLEAEVLQQRESLPPEKLEDLVPAVLDAKSLQDLDLSGR